MSDVGYMRFDMQVSRWSDLLGREANALKRKIALDLLAGVVEMTPVKTGRARGNWQVTLNTPAEGETGREDEDGRSTIADGQVAALGALPGDDIWIVNNVPYMWPLEHGHSRVQAPHGMLAVTLARIESVYS